MSHIKHATWFGLLLATVLDLPTVAIAVLSSLFIDIDHWLWSIWAFRHWSPFQALQWHRECYEDRSCLNYHITCVFHTLEVLALLGAVAFVSPVARAVFLGFTFHVACDLVHDFILHPEERLDFRVKYLLVPFLSKVARGEVFIQPEARAARRQ
ncbi:MAG: hypothetical protein ACE5H5_02620 [Nitrospinota bacterium]